MKNSRSSHPFSQRGARARRKKTTKKNAPCASPVLSSLSHGPPPHLDRCSHLVCVPWRVGRWPGWRWPAWVSGPPGARPQREALLFLHLLRPRPRARPLLSPALLVVGARPRATCCAPAGLYSLSAQPPFPRRRPLLLREYQHPLGPHHPYLRPLHLAAWPLPSPPPRPAWPASLRAAWAPSPWPPRPGSLSGHNRRLVWGTSAVTPPPPRPPLPPPSLTRRPG